MRAVNLLPADLRGAKVRSSSGPPPNKIFQIAGIVAIVLAVLFVAGFVIERSHVHHKKSVLAHDEARIVAVQARVNSIKNAQAQAAARYTVMKSVVSTRMNWDRALTDFARVLPRNVYLSSLQASAPVPAASVPTTSGTTDSTSTTDSSSTTAPVAPTTGSVLTISGIAPSHPGVATVLDQLSLLPWLSNVTLVSTARQSDGTVSFSVTATAGEVH
jgi:Tfp pilus assembly protein PilN